MSKKSQTTIPCKMCDSGKLERKKKYVLGSGGAIFKFLFVIPGLLITLIGGCTTVGTGSVVADVNEQGSQRSEQRIAAIESTLATAEIPQDLINALKKENFSSSIDISKLTPEQQEVVTQAQVEFFSSDMEDAGADIATGLFATIFGGAGLIMLIGGFCMIGLGLIIGIKKWQLICNSCGSSIKAA